MVSLVIVASFLACKTFKFASEPSISLSSIIVLASVKVVSISSTPSTNLIVPFAIFSKDEAAVANFSLKILEFVSNVLVPFAKSFVPASNSSIFSPRVEIDDVIESNLSNIPKSNSDKTFGEATI